MTKKKTTSRKKSAPGTSLPKDRGRNPDPDLAALRKKAEARLRSQSSRLDELSTKDIKTLVHELGTYQIELEMQNEELRKASEELEYSRAKYADLFDFAPVGYFTFDKQGTIIEANLTGAGMLGFSRRELIKKPFSVFVHKEDQDDFYMHRNKIFDAPLRENCEIRLKRKDGSLFWAQLQSIVIEESDHQRLYCRTAVSDVSERKLAEDELQASEDRFRSTFENAAVGIAHVGLDDSLIRVNSKFCDIVGYSSEELTQMTFQVLTCPDDLKRDLQLAERLRIGEIKSYTTEKRYIHKEGHTVWINLTESLQRDESGEPEHFISIVEDINWRKQAEDSLKESFIELERSNRDLEQFAYIVSHDLKEPLRMITSYVQLLNKRYKGNLDKNADDYINYIVEGVTRMDDLLNDLLWYSRVGKNTEPFEPVDLNSSVKKALDNLRRVIKKSDAEIQYSKLPTVTADEVQMVQVFQNLIGNAIKFCGSETPRINVSARLENIEWIICINDNGIGIDPKHLDRIFLMFRRLHARGKYPGTGVGLSICKKIVERHGGEIWAESEPGKGSEFCFTMPAGMVDKDSPAKTGC